MGTDAGVRHALADAIGQTLEGVVASSHGQDYAPQLVELLGD